MDQDSTFQNLKTKIKEEEEYEPEEQELLIGFYPVDSTCRLKDICNDGDTITVLISRQKAPEKVTLSNVSNETFFMIIGVREKFEIIPFKKETRELSSSFFQKYQKFGIVSKTRGEDGERVFTCNIYEVKDCAKVEIRDREKIFQFIGTLPEQMQVKKQKVFKESELKKGFLSQNMRDALTVITSITGATCKIVSVAGGLA